MKTIVLVLGMAAAGLAQERGNDRGMATLKDRLGLTEEQATKIQEIFAKDQEDRDRLDEQRVAKVKEFLTDEQKPKYDELRRQVGRGGAQAFRGQGGLGGFGRGNALQLENLKTELGLTDEQVEKIKPIVDEQSAAVTKRMEELRQGGFQGLDWQAELGKLQEAVKSASEKVKVHLNDEQKTKLDGLVERSTALFRMLPGLAGGRGAAATPTRASAEERVRRAMDALKIEKEDESSALRRLLEKVVKAQDAMEDALKGSRDRAGEAARNAELSEQAIEDRLDEVRKERHRLEKELSDLQGALTDVVSVRQEAELVQQGILK